MVGLTALLALGALMGCSEQSAQKEDPVDTPSMEQALTDYIAFQDDAVATLDERFGVKPWAVSENTGEFSAAGCGDDDDQTQSATMPLISFSGSWEKEQWPEVQATMREVGQRHGFTQFEQVLDRADDFKIIGTDAWGGRFTFGSAVNTVFDVETGCHVWADEWQWPPAGAEWRYGAPES